MNETKNKNDEFLYSIWNFFAASLSEKTRKNYYNEYGWYIEFKYNLATTPSATVSGKAYGFAVRCVQAN